MIGSWLCTMNLNFNKKKKLLFVYSKSVNHPKIPILEKGRIRAVVAYSNIGIRPVSPKRTYVELTILADPKGSIPAWLVNFFQKKWPVAFLKALEKRSQTGVSKLARPLKLKIAELLKSMKLPKTYFSYKTNSFK